MKIGIKYCGGCNPHFDRIDKVNKLMELFKDVNFEYAKENKTYDLILVVNGCGRGCSDHSSLRGKEKIIINHESDYLEAIKLIHKHKNLK